MEVRPVLFVLLLVSSVNGYNIKINPIVKTSVTNLKNTGDNNSIQLATITNSTILQAAVPQQLYQSHYNELLSTSVILVIFSFLFIILSVIITKITLVLFKLNQRISQIEVRIQWYSSTTRNWYSWILWSYLSFSEKSTFYILSPNWLSASKWDQLSWWSFFSCSTFIWTLTDIYTRYGSTILLLLISTHFIIQSC